MRGFAKVAVTFYLTLILTGCTVPLPSERIGGSSNYIHDRNNLFCSGSFDRTPLGSRVNVSRVDTSSEMIVGYDNILYRGADPFPCNTSHMTLFIGKTKFNAPADLIARVNRAGGVLGATLVLQRHSTGVPIMSRDGSPRGAEACNFTVHATPRDWPAGLTATGRIVNFGQSTGVINGGEPPALATFTNFDASPTEIRISSAALTRAVQAWATGESVNNGFEIRPEISNPEIFRGLSNATCTATFSDPVLEVIIPRDS